MIAKKTIKHCVYEEDYAQNPSLGGCKWDKHCEIDEYLKKCTCIKSITGDLVTTSDETVHVPETVLI